jgi:hypothetical protein
LDLFPCSKEELDIYQKIDYLDFNKPDLDKKIFKPDLSQLLKINPHQLLGFFFFFL